MILQLAYIGLSILMTAIIVRIGLKAIHNTFNEKSVAGKKKVLLIASLAGWHLYILILASTEVMLDLSFPPKFFLFTILPAFLFTGIFIYKNRNNSWIQNIPSHWLFFYQTFRIGIETIFIFTVAKGILQPNVTIEGYNFDLIYAFTVLLIGSLTYKNIKKYKRLIVWWNYLGLAVIAVIIFLFQSTIYFPEIYGNIEPFPVEFLKYPYVLVPSFLMPSAVFIHILSIVQLKNAT